MLPGASVPPLFNGLIWSTTNPGHAPEVLPVAGQGLLAWNALLAAGLRAIRPLAVRAQLQHLFVEDSECPTAERRSDRAADRGALRGAERGLLRLVEAHAGVAQTMRQSATTNCRIIMHCSIGVLRCGQ
jgi:hypothetical protein